MSAQARFKVVVVVLHLLHLKIPEPLLMRRQRVISVFSLQYEQITQEPPKRPELSMFHAGTCSTPMRFRIVEEEGWVP